LFCVKAKESEFKEANLRQQGVEEGIALSPFAQSSFEFVGGLQRVNRLGLHHLTTRGANVLASMFLGWPASALAHTHTHTTCLSKDGSR